MQLRQSVQRRSDALEGVQLLRQLLSLEQRALQLRLERRVRVGLAMEHRGKRRLQLLGEGKRAVHVCALLLDDAHHLQPHAGRTGVCLA